MVFIGNGEVRWNGRTIANFITGQFETNDNAVIGRLKELGYKEFTGETKEVFTQSDVKTIDTFKEKASPKKRKK